MSARSDQERLEHAAAWRVRLTESGRVDVPEFTLWLAEDPRNEAAWRAVQTPWQMLGEYAASSELIVQRRAALAGRPRAARGAVLRDWTRRPTAIAAVCAVAAVAVGAALLFWQTHQSVIYRTGAGERRVVTLADGSQITLDTRSEVAVRYTVHSRELELDRGQARFDVAHDVERPFTVAARGHKVVATGTAFDVDMLGRDLRVTLIEGHVVVLPQNAPTRPYVPGVAGTLIPADWSRIVLDPGEQLSMPMHGVPHVDRVNLERVTAWERGQVAFKNDLLAVVVARMNRYSKNPIVIGDASTANLRISGVFHEGDVDGFVNTLASYLPIRASSGPGGSIVLTSAPPTKHL